MRKFNLRFTKTILAKRTGLTKKWSMVFCKCPLVRDFLDLIPQFFKLIQKPNSPNSPNCSPSLRYVEHGLLVRMNSCLRQHSFSPSKRIKIFRSINDYVDEKTDFSDLALTNFQSIFLVYFFVCFIIFTGYLVDLLVALEFFPKFFLNLLFVAFRMLNLWKKSNKRRKCYNKTAPSQTDARLC